MGMGERIRQARLEMGLTQKALCGDQITRNMLSQIENGSASASIGTLTYLARKLGKPVSFFLEEEGTFSANASIMDEAWRVYESGDYAGVQSLLETLTLPDPVLQRDISTLRCLNFLGAAEQALEQNRTVYARELLSKAEEAESLLPWLPELRQRRLQLLSQLPGQKAIYLPNLDDGLIAHAKASLSAHHWSRAALLLDCVEERNTPLWSFLRGEAALRQKEYAYAADCFQKAEAAYPNESISKLEQCFRELGDYKMAYFYACKSRERE